MSHPKIKFSYWPLAGRTAVAQTCLNYANIPYEFEALDGEAWGAAQNDRKRFPLGDIPVVSVDNEVIAESLPMTLYCANLAGLLPTDPLGNARTVELLCTLEIIISGAEGTSLNKATYEIQDAEEKEKAYKGPVSDRIKWYFERIEQVIAANPSGYSVGDKLSVADLNIVGFVNHIKSVPAIADDIITGSCPAVVALIGKVMGDPKVGAAFGSLKPKKE